MSKHYVLSGNVILGHFDSLRESWTLEEAVEMAGIVTTQSALSGYFFEGLDCVFVDDESGEYVFNVEGCRVLDFEPNADVLELCERIRKSGEWDLGDACILCALARLSDEWLNASSENFEQVVCAAAEKLGGVVL